jgi:hypothetical protein
MARRRRSVEEEENGVVNGPIEGDFPQESLTATRYVIDFDDAHVSAAEADAKLLAAVAA